MATNEKETALARKESTVEQWLQSDTFQAAVKKALPSHLTAKRFIRVALTAMMRTPQLAQCSRESIFKAMLDLSSLGLEPDGRRAHLIPYHNRKIGKLEAQLLIDYKGLIELSKRSGEVANWRAEIVCENDEFSWENGVVFHRVDWFKPRGKIQAVYSHVKNKNSVDDYEVMTIDQVTAIRKRSKAANSGPWVTDFAEMAKKTVMRRHSKRLTLSPEFNDALVKDIDRIDTDDGLSLDDMMPQRLSAPETNEPPSAEGAQSEPEQEPQVEPGQQELPTESKMLSEKQVKRLFAIAKTNGVEADVVKEYVKLGYKLDDVKLLTREQYDATVAWAQKGGTF